MNSYSVPVNQHAGNTGVSSALSAQPQQPIQGTLDILEKSLVNLRDDVLRLEGRLNPVLNIGPTRADNSGAPQAQNGSALTARLAHLGSLVLDIQATVNTIHTQLEL